jgi:hypothetical protein
VLPDRRSGVITQEVHVKKLAVFAAVALVSSGAFAAGTIRDNCGCGIGTMALGENEPTVFSQVAATFLNVICGNQTFGITSGTLECNESAGIASNSRIQQYVADNMDQLAADIAVGQGESLNALADLMDVPATGRADLYATLQGNFDRIFTTSEISSTDVVQNLDKVING